LGNHGRARWKGSWRGDFSWGGGWRLSDSPRARGDGGQLIVRNYANDENGLAGFDFVARGEHGLVNLCAIQLGAIGAFSIDDAAAVGTALDGEVDAGHVIVMGNGKLRAVWCAPDQKRLASSERDLPTREGSHSDFENDRHSVDSNLTFEVTQSPIS